MTPIKDLRDEAMLNYIKTVRHRYFSFIEIKFSLMVIERLLIDISRNLSSKFFQLISEICRVT